MQVISFLAAASLVAAQGFTFTPTTLSTLSFSDAPKPVTSTSYSTTLTFPTEPEPTETAEPEEPEPDAPPELPTLVSASYSGSGCPQGSVDFPDDVNINDTVFSLPEFYLNTTSGVMGKTKNCAVHLNLADSPAGWQFAVSEVRLADVEYSLEEEAALRIWFTTFFSADAANTVTLQYRLATNGIRYLILSVPEENRLWSACGGDDIVNMSLRVLIDDSSVDRAEGESSSFGTAPLLEKFTYVWRTCGEDGVGDDEPSNTFIQTGSSLTLTETLTDVPTETETPK